MKRILLVFSFVILMGGLRSQDIVEARRLVYYERYEGAAQLLQSLLRADPNNAEAWWLLTEADVNRGKVKEIKDRLLALPEENRRAPLVLCAYGQVLLMENKKDSAKMAFDRALEETRQKEPEVLLAVAKSQQTGPAGDAAYSVELLNAAIKRARHNPALYVALGNAYRKLTDGSGSYKAYQDALTQDAGYCAADYRLGKIFVSQGNAEMYLKYFNASVASDSLYAPAWYELYYHYYFRDVNKAMDALNHYIAASDKSIKNDYLMTDLLYASGKYGEAIEKAQRLIGQEADASEPRLYKLIAYSYKELNDSAKALAFMTRYFKEQRDTGFVVKDFETMGEIYDKMMGKPDSAAAYYARAEAMEKDTVKKAAYSKKLADLYKSVKDYTNQAVWLGKYYYSSSKATNLDLFNWGLANYMAKDYVMADSVFGIYETKYPEQDFGYYWRARSNAAIDTAMQTGRAIPHYTKLIEVASKDSADKTIRKHLIESYGYIAAYKANTEKDFAGSIDYFTRLLELDPGNTDARRYIEILQKNQNKAASKASPKEVQKDEKDADKKTSGKMQTKAEISKAGR